MRGALHGCFGKPRALQKDWPSSTIPGWGRHAGWYYAPFPLPALSLGDRVKSSLPEEQFVVVGFPLRSARCSLPMNRTRKLLEMNDCSKTGSWAQGAIKVRGDLSPRERVRVRGKRREGPARILGHSETARVLPDPFMISSFAFAEVHLPFVASEAAAPPGSGRRVSFRRSTRVPSIVWTRNS